MQGWLVLAACAVLALPADAAVGTVAAVSTDALKRMSLEELLSQRVVLTSRTPQRLGDAASGIQVISGQAIRASGATRLPEALRLASNLHVAQVDASRWAIGARGFNSVLSNKLLVMVDGRAIYSPLFAGVFWDMQDVLLADVEQIEVVSGPGGPLWGANAVNGVINVRSRAARDTQGWFASTAGGSGLRQMAAARYGGQLGSTGHFRVYGQFREHAGTVGLGADSDWDRVQAGFRSDWDLGSLGELTLQGDLFRNRGAGGVLTSTSRGGNLLTRWTRHLADESEIQLQLYFDRVRRDFPGQYDDRLDTYDVDFQHRLETRGAHDIVWGANYRYMRDDFEPGRVILQPPRRTLDRGSVFFQDTIGLMEDTLKLTLGAKAEYNNYTDVELQPNVRVSWRRNPREIYWAALSRAVRTPSRQDRDRFFPGVLGGGPNFDAEALLAWEAGVRMQPDERLSLAATVFYHDYDDIRSIERTPAGSPLPFEIGNGQFAYSYGMELVADLQVTDWWQVHAGWTELRVVIEPEPGSVDQSFGAIEAVDANRYASVRSTFDLPGEWALWLNLRGASRLTNPTSNTPGYVELDARVSWRPHENWELSVAGQNLLHDSHVEYGDPTMRFAVERSIYALVRWSY